MRKLVTGAIVCAMTLTLFLGLFGGVVDEVRGPSTYDASSNTIYVTGNGNTLWTIWLDTGQNASLFDQAGPSSYITYANIHVTFGSDLTIISGDILKFDFNLNITVSGELYVNGAEGDMAVFSSNSTIPAKGDWQGLVFNTTEASNSNVNYLNLSYATIGIECIGSSPTISNTVVTQCSDNGISLVNANLILNSVQFSNNGNGNSDDAGLLLISSSPFIENSTFINNPDSDIRLKSGSHPIILNSSFDFGKIIFSDATGSNLTVKWYLEVYVEDDETFQPVDGAIIEILDIFDNRVEGSPFTSNTEGVVSWIQAVSYVRDNSGKIDHTPHNITVSHSEYYTGYANPEPNVISSMRVQVNLTMIRRDLTTNTENITFSPDGIVVANEDVTIFAKIHNIEIDDAENVQVIITDYAPEGPLEIHNSTISLIEGNNFKNAIDIWQPTPGVHSIEVNIDPYNEINEINSNESINAETNNVVTVPLSVNSRPLINITGPLEFSEVNETITIQGTGYDDIADDTVNTNGPNWIVQVEIRLLGYDWIESDTLLFNPIPPDWIWDYQWDTTQWNGTPLPDGNYTLQARAWDNYHYSFIYEVPITINNTGANEPPNPVINEPLNNSVFNVLDAITFNGSSSIDDQTLPENLIFSWDFDDSYDANGDGNPTNDDDAFGNVTTHAYDAKGTYNITLNVTDEGGLYNTTTVAVIINNYRPVVDITVNSTTVYEDDTVEFNGSASFDPDGIITSYTWDFDDGVILSGPLPTINHSFNESRIFNVTLTVQDNIGVYNSTWILIEVLPNEAPNAQIDEPIEGWFFSVNETITFNASGSSDQNDPDLEYYWDFGNGDERGWISDPVTTYHYPDVGPWPLYEFTVTLTVRDDEQLEDTDTVTIVVNNYPPVAIATSDKTSADTYENITFDGSDSYDPPPSPGALSYFWDFDDGEFSFEEVVVHQFTQNGTYNVTLTVFDGVANDTDWIIISIANTEPAILNVTVEPEFPVVGEEVYINISAVDKDGTIVEYRWTFGDGGSYYENETYHEDGAFDGSTTHVYTSRSSYTVVVEVRDDDGFTNSSFKQITLVNAVPQAIITYPDEDDTLSEIETITGTSSDSDGTVSYVEVRIDDGDWIQVTDTSTDDSWSTWEYIWDTEDEILNGEHTIHARAYDGENYTDPADSVNVTVDNIPSSITATITVDPESVQAGGSVNINGSVMYNTGDPVDGADVNITIQFQTGGWDTTTASDGTYSIVITAPEDSGNHKIYIDAEIDTFSDTDYTILSVTPLPERPDLTLSDSDIDFNPSSPFSGETVQITATVSNIGKAHANNVLVNMYDGDPDSGGSSIGSKTVSVSANSQTNVVLDWATSDSTGTVTVHVVIDPNNAIDEEDEDNNKAQKPITIKGKPDLVVNDEDITFPTEEAKVGQRISISITIYNEGTESGSFTYDIYEGDPDAGGILVDSREETIAAGRDKTVIVQWMPEESGDFEIFIVLDPGEDVDELDEDNNEARASISVAGEPESQGFPGWLLWISAIIGVIVLGLIIYLNRRGGVSRAQPQLPLAQVVDQEVMQKPQKSEKSGEKKEEAESLMGSHGGIRLG